MQRFAFALGLSALGFCSVSAATIDVPAAIVRYDDLNVASTTGHRALLARLDKATGFICGQPDYYVGLARMQGVRRCKSESLAVALGQVDWTTPGAPVAADDLPLNRRKASVNSFAPASKARTSVEKRPAVRRGMLNHKGVFVPAPSIRDRREDVSPAAKAAARSVPLPTQR